MDLMKIMQQAKEMQSKMQTLQEQFADIDITGVAGGGMVDVTLNAKGDMKRIKIDPSLLKAEENEILEDLIVAAHNDARAKMQSAVQEKMQAAMGDLKLPPGFKLPF